MASLLCAMTLIETEKNAHGEKTVSKIIASENKKGLQDAGCLEASEDFSERPLDERLKLKVRYNRETLATTEENTPIQELRPRIILPEKIEELTDKALEDFSTHLFIEI